MSALLAALKPAKQGLGGGDIVSLTRMATQKTLTEPDPELNGDVVSALKKGYASPEATADALRARLRQANPHKVWLAVELSRVVLTKAPEATRHVRARVLEEVERVASSPMNRYGSDLKGQQMAKTAAFKLVSEYAAGSLLPGSGGGGGGSANGNGNGGEGANAAAAQGQRRRPKPAPHPQDSEGAEAAPDAVGGPSRKPQTMRKVTQADRGGGGGEPPASPRGAGAGAGASSNNNSSASPRRGANDDGPSNSSSSAPSPAPRGRWARVLEAAAAGEATGKRYVQSMSDALMLLASAVARSDSKAAAAADAAAASLAREMVQFNGALERVVAQVATGGAAGAAAGNKNSSNSNNSNSSSSSKSLVGPEAEAVTRRCLATTDAVCAALALHAEVMYAQRARAADKEKGGAAAAGAHGGGAAAGAADAEEEDSDEDDDDLDELASALEAAVVVSPAAAAAETAEKTTTTTTMTTAPALSLPRSTSNNPFDTAAAVAVAVPAAAAAPAAAAEFDDAAFFAAPAAVATPAAPVAPAAPAPAAASANFADLLK